MLKGTKRGGAHATDASRKPSVVPAGRRVYAVGDIHGRRDLLGRIHRAILADARGAERVEKVCVYVGDYVDRGADSRGVIEALLAAPLDGFRTVYLLGNHEDMMLRFLEDAALAPLWISNGGDATLQSYGIDWRARVEADDLDSLRMALREALPASHLKFLRALALSHREGDYMFVHAGIRPGRDLGHQDIEDLIWIRDEFLHSDADHGAVVVHGHSITSGPDLRDNRIGIDTGAYASGKLSCLVLEGGAHRFLQT